MVPDHVCQKIIDATDGSDLQHVRLDLLNSRIVRVFFGTAEHNWNEYYDRSRDRKRRLAIIYLPAVS